MRNPLKYHPFFIKLGSWEYWPQYVAAVPVLGFFLYQSLRAGSLAFFTAVNPRMYMSGFYGTPKSEINRLIPSKYLPWSMLIHDARKEPSAVMTVMREASISFPVILKPNVGERGFNVYKVNSYEELTRTLSAVKGDVLLQEFVSYKLETTVLCYKIPGTDERGVTSMCLKEFLSVTGNGKASIRELAQRNPRAILQLQRLESRLNLDRVPALNEKVELEPIGNHNRGTMFINANHLINEHITKVFMGILDQMEDVQFGRFDLRARSIEDLMEGNHFKILEFNGVNAEPVHIYDPHYPVWKAYRDLWRHWNLIRRIAAAQHKKGVQYRRTDESWRAFRDYLDYKKRATVKL